MCACGGRGEHRGFRCQRNIPGAPAGSRPRLLLAKDSFGSALAPFLARHFDIVAVNLTGGMTELSTLADTYACDYVLVVCNRENVLTSDCLTRLK